MKGNMHFYSTDTNERRLSSVYLVIICILLAYHADFLLTKFNFPLPWWLGVPGIMGFYGAIYYLFREYLWKNKFIRFVFRIKTPNWNGNYSCILRTSYDRFAQETKFTVRIKQNWDSICILTETDFSFSTSLSGSFSIKNTINPTITYEYLNQPKNASPDTMNIHRGMASIWFENGKINGDFFTGRGRNTHGYFTQP
jgi:hypothetical protein